MYYHSPMDRCPCRIHQLAWSGYCPLASILIPPIAAININLKSFLPSLLHQILRTADTVLSISATFKLEACIKSMQVPL
uniref:Uncharacterized protein n=1 Tax=Arundo donax TaxID=35708 RepID=A0A0A9F374_ARUDO